MVHQAGGTLGATLQVTDSRVIWQTNGALAWNIFQANPERAVYVEASQWIPWMDDHLEPAGLAMRLNRAQGDLEGLAARNADFWEWMARRLAADEAYRRDFAARRAFSSLSVSIAGLYARKGLFHDWLAQKGKLGGQHKIPRLSNTREYIEEMLALNK